MAYTKEELWSIGHLGMPGFAVGSDALGDTDRAMLDGLYASITYQAFVIASLLNIELSASVVFGLGLTNTPTFGMAMGSTSVLGLSLTAEPQE